MYYFLIILELLSLFILSRQLTQSLSLLLQLLHFREGGIVVIIALIFLPGTVVHELSHLLMAKLLFVPTGQLSLLPRLQGNMVKMGSVAVARTDPLRNLLIGVAPFLSGIAILFGSLLFFLPKLSSFNYWIIGIFLYVLFVITNSMFSSKKDVEGAGIFVLLFALVIGAFYFIKPQQFLAILTSLTYVLPTNYILSTASYLAIPLLIDVCVIVTLKLAIRTLQ